MGTKHTTEVIYKPDPQLTALIQNYSKSNEELKKKMVEMNNKYNQELKDLNLQFGQKLKEATEKVENEFKSREIAKEKELKEKEEKANENYTNLTNNFMVEYLNEIKQEFNNQKNSFCKEKIEKYNNQKIVELIQNISYSESMENTCKFQLKEIIQNLSKSSRNLVEHLNILLIGPSGVGKSTLINNILHLSDREKAPTNSTNCCTKEIKEYTSNVYPFLRLYDSRGIEKSEKYGINIMKQEIIDFINNKELTNDPDKYIHCIWYCYTGKRFEGIEKECLIELSKLYDNSNLPIIIVYTQCISKKDYLAFKNNIDGTKKNLTSIEIMAEPYYLDDLDITIQRKNLDDLLKISIDKAINAIKSSCYTSLKECAKKEINKILKEKNDNLTVNVHNKIVNLVRKMDDNSDESQVISELLNIFQTIFITYLYGNQTRKDINNNSKELCKSFLEEYFKETMNNYENELNPIVCEKATKGTEKFLEIQNDIIIQFEGLLKKGKVKHDIEKEIKNRIIDSLKKLAENYCKRNSALFIATPIQKYFAEKIQKVFLELLNSNQEISNEIIDNSKSNFNKLKEEINNVKFNN